MSDRIERLLLAKQEDIDTLGSELEIAERERDRYRRALQDVVSVRYSSNFDTINAAFDAAAKALNQ